MDERADAMHTVGEGVAITTDDWFVKVTFNITGPEGTEIDLTAAHLERDGKQFAFARDAQAASKKPAHLALAKNGDTVWAFFEVPNDALGKGLSLVVPDGEKTARLELQ